MIEPIEFEYKEIKVRVRVAWAGWQYEFDYDDKHYFDHYQDLFWAIDGAKEKIRQLKQRIP